MVVEYACRVTTEAERRPLLVVLHGELALLTQKIEQLEEAGRT